MLSSNRKPALRSDCIFWTWKQAAVCLLLVSFERELNICSVIWLYTALLLVWCFDKQASVFCFYFRQRTHIFCVQDNSAIIKSSAHQRSLAFVFLSQATDRWKQRRFFVYQPLRACIWFHMEMTLGEIVNDCWTLQPLMQLLFNSWHFYFLLDVCTAWKEILHPAHKYEIRLWLKWCNVMMNKWLRMLRSSEENPETPVFLILW